MDREQEERDSLRPESDSLETECDSLRTGGGSPEEERLSLEEENERLRTELQELREKNLKERMYDHVHVSVRTMDIFIGVLVVLFFAVIIMGLMNK